MKPCNGCTVCCKITTVPILKKKSNEWCKHCRPRSGCSIYESRPQVCIDFHCFWQISDQSEEWRPDRLHFYSIEEGDLVKVRVDLDYPWAWCSGIGKEVVNYYRAQGKHVLVNVGQQLTFLPAFDKPVPEKLLIDWLL